MQHYRDDAMWHEEQGTITRPWPLKGEQRPAAFAIVCFCFCEFPTVSCSGKLWRASRWLCAKHVGLCTPFNIKTCDKTNNYKMLHKALLFSKKPLILSFLYHKSATACQIDSKGHPGENSNLHNIGRSNDPFPFEPLRKMHKMYRSIQALLKNG